MLSHEVAAVIPSPVVAVVAIKVRLTKKNQTSQVFRIFSPPEFLDLVKAKPLPYFVQRQRSCQVLFVGEEQYRDSSQMRILPQRIQIIPDIL